MAGSSRTACPLARPYGGTSVSDDARRARSGAPGQRSDQQSAKESARALSALPHAARSAAPFSAAVDHLPPAAGSRRSLPRPVLGNDRRADIETDVARAAIRSQFSHCLSEPGAPLLRGVKTQQAHVAVGVAADRDRRSTIGGRRLRRELFDHDAQQSWIDWRCDGRYGRRGRHWGESQLGSNHRSLDQRDRRDDQRRKWRTQHLWRRGCNWTSP